MTPLDLGSNEHAYNYGTYDYTENANNTDTVANYGSGDTSVNNYYTPPSYDYGCYDGEDPIILNLTGGVVDTQGVKNSQAMFDMQNNGHATQTGWATAGEGILVYDPSNPNGAVTHDAQLVAGFSVLQGMDTNNDMALSCNDAAWSNLRVWVDTTGTGKFESMNRPGNRGGSLL